MPARLTAAAAALLCAALVGCAHSPSYDPLDPLEPVNRKVFTFNATVDHYVTRPVADAYTRYVPDALRNRIRDFLNNATYPTVIVNDLLQGKFRQAGLDTARFLTNTTAGIGGLWDVATRAGLPAHDEDFGQTLGRWGVGQGWFLMLPILGPTTNRDLVGRGVDYFTDPTNQLEPRERIALGLLYAVETRAGLLGTDQLVNQQFDPYAFLRTAYLDSRRFKVHDGSPPPEPLPGFDLDELDELDTGG